MKHKTIKLLFVSGAIIIIVILAKLYLFLLFQKDNFFGQAIFDFLKESIIAMIAGFFGPLYGFIVGFFGILLGYSSFDFGIIHKILYNVMVAPYSFLKHGLYGLFIGVFWKKYNFLGNFITLKSILLFCIVKIASDILFLDVIDWLINNIFFIFITNIHMIIINKIIYTIPCFIILLIYSKVKIMKNIMR